MGTSVNNNVGIRNSFPWFPFQVWDGGTSIFTGVSIDPGNNPSEIGQMVSLKSHNSGLLVNVGSQDSGRGQSGILFGTGVDATAQKTTLFAQTFDFNFIAYADILNKTTLAGTAIGTTVGTKVVTINNILGQGPHLRVLGGIKAQKVTVTQNVWADYVFADDFKLRPLAEVATFIGKNKHLPDVPSQSEITANGLDLGEMQKIHMQKIEELTLYLLEQEKRIQELEQKLLQISKKK